MQKFTKIKGFVSAFEGPSGVIDTVCMEMMIIFDMRFFSFVATAWQCSYRLLTKLSSRVCVMKARGCICLVLNDDNPTVDRIVVIVLTAVLYTCYTVYQGKDQTVNTVSLSGHR